MSYSGNGGYNPKRQVNTITSSRSQELRDSDLYVDDHGMIRRREVEPQRPPSSDLDSQEKGTSVYDPTKEPKHSSWFVEEEKTDSATDLPIMGANPAEIRNFSRPTSRSGL